MVSTASPFHCTIKVTTLTAAASAKNGIFSSTSFAIESGRAVMVSDLNPAG